MRLPAVVRTPAVQNRSLIASGMPVSGPRLATRQRRIGRLGLAQRRVRRDGDEGVQSRVQRRDRVEMRLRQLHGRKSFARASAARACGDRKIEHHSTTFGTAKKSPARSGALARIASGDVAVGHHVLAQRSAICAPPVSGCDAVHIHLVQLLDPAEDAVQFGLQPRDFGRRRRGCGRVWQCGGRSRDRATCNVPWCGVEGRGP